MSRAEIRTERLRAALRSIPMFHGLQPAELARIERIASIRDFRRGERLWAAGDASEAFTLILRGRVKVVRHGPGGDVILEIFGVGEPVGAIAVYDGIPYPATAIAIEPVSVIWIPRLAYFDLLGQHPEFTRAVLRELTRLSLALARRLGEQRGQRVEARIARLFMSLAERMGQPGAAGIEIRLPLTRLEVAEMVGTTVESAIRVLSRWGREGLLVTHEYGFVIREPDRLKAAATADEGGDP